MAELIVTRLLQNPLGQVAPAGSVGDIVRVSDGMTTTYLLPEEFDLLDDRQLRQLLVDAAYRVHRDASPVRAMTQPSGRSRATVTDSGARRNGSIAAPQRPSPPTRPMW